MSLQEGSKSGPHPSIHGKRTDVEYPWCPVRKMLFKWVGKVHIFLFTPGYIPLSSIPFCHILSGNELNQIEWTEMVLTKHTLCICCTVTTLAGYPECFPASSDGTKYTKWAPCISKSVLNKIKEGFMVDISIWVCLKIG